MKWRLYSLRAVCALAIALLPWILFCDLLQRSILRQPYQVARYLPAAVVHQLVVTEGRSAKKVLATT